MPVQKGLLVTTPQKPDVSDVGVAPSAISTTEVNQLSYEDSVALDRAMYADIVQQVNNECGYVNNDSDLEKVKTKVLKNTVENISKLANIPVPSISCSTLRKFQRFFANVEDIVKGPLQLAQELYADSLDALKFVRDQVLELSKFCDGLDTTTSYTARSGELGFLGIIDVALEIADPELWAKIAECGNRLANLPNSILAEVTRTVAAQTIESFVIIADSVSPEKLSALDDKLRESAKLIGNKLENLTTWESLLTITGLTKDQLISVLPFGFNPGGDLLFAKDVYDAVRNGGGTVVYQSVIVPSVQQMASAAVEKNKFPKPHITPVQNGGDNPKVKSVISNAAGIIEKLSGRQPSQAGKTLVFGDTYTDQTGFIHILNDRISIDEKIGIFRNNKQVRARKLNPVPIPIPSYTP